MKNLFKTFSLLAIVILMHGFGNNATAQTVELGNLGIGVIKGSPDSYVNLTATSSDQTSYSTATLSTVIDGTNKAVTLDEGYDLSGYFGDIIVADDMTLNLISTGTKTIKGRFFTAESATTGTNYLKFTNSAGLSIDGVKDSRTITLNNRGSLDLRESTSDITIAGSLYLNSYEGNPPSIHYAPAGDLATTLPKIIINGTGASLKSNHVTDGKLYAPLHFIVNLEYATAADLVPHNYPVVQLTSTTIVPTFDQTNLKPGTYGNNDGSWTVGDMNVTSSGDQRNVNINLTYSPLFQLDATVFATTPYAANWGTMMTKKTTGIIDDANYLQTLRREQLTGFDGSQVVTNVSIDLGVHTLAGANQQFVITTYNSLALKKGTGGNFDGQIYFQDAFFSRVVWMGTGVTSAIFGLNFAYANQKGTLQIGDGTNAATASIVLGTGKIYDNFTRVVVSSGANLTIGQPDL